jgi:putative FmdB family regulatory protein
MYMPAYEYRCLDCRKRFDVVMSYAEYGSKAVVCPHCASLHVQRRIGRVRVAKSDQSHLADMADPAMLDRVDDDPRALGRMMRQMSSQIGEDMGPEFHEVVGRLEAGDTPDEIERDLPDVGGGMPAGDMGGLDDDF